jgi:hypothetical protein
MIDLATCKKVLEVRGAEQRIKAASRLAPFILVKDNQLLQSIIPFDQRCFYSWAVKPIISS